MKVIVTGDFDNWSQSVEMTAVSGVFEADIREGIFKFVADGEWIVSHEYAVVTDEQGNQNNILREGIDLAPIEQSIETPEVAEMAAGEPKEELKQDMAAEVPKEESKQDMAAEEPKEESRQDMAAPKVLEKVDEAAIEGLKHDVIALVQIVETSEGSKVELMQDIVAPVEYAPIVLEAEKAVASVVGNVDSALQEAKSEVTVVPAKKKKSFFNMFKKEKKDKKVVLAKGDKGPIFRRVTID
ncbi:hypothetical protein HDV01_007855 [Terramyces sp. JEL0728]|nr:hypothetical protein HDV01_007855 [Terramyces sp. JEL0728]